MRSLVFEIRHQRRQAITCQPVVLCQDCDEGFADMKAVEKHAAATGHQRYRQKNSPSLDR